MTFMNKKFSKLLSFFTALSINVFPVEGGKKYKKKQNHRNVSSHTQHKRQNLNKDDYEKLDSFLKKSTNGELNSFIKNSIEAFGKKYVLENWGYYSKKTKRFDSFVEGLRDIVLRPAFLGWHCYFKNVDKFDRNKICLNKDFICTQDKFDECCKILFMIVDTLYEFAKHDCHRLIGDLRFLCFEKGFDTRSPYFQYIDKFDNKNQSIDDIIAETNRFISKHS